MGSEMCIRDRLYFDYYEKTKLCVDWLWNGSGDSICHFGLVSQKVCNQRSKCELSDSGNRFIDNLCAIYDL